jgi:hypothetical protein
MATNVFDLFAKISLDSKGFEKGLDDSKSKFSKFGDGLKNAAGKLGDVLAGIGTAAAAGVGAASTAFAVLTKKSLDAVGNYEQLVGGVDTLFKDASQKVQDYANQAYMTAGLSANEYMEQTISFSASLIQGLQGDTQKAADLANMAIIDMSDNVNKMGTTMEAVQNAYNGLQRQNFTMLDNLKLGYQGTASEMARLINDSGVMGDAFEATAENVKDISFDKYIEAIHKVQEELGITGTTSKEAAGTITGSVSSMKAAFQNFLTGTGSAKQFTDVLTNSFGNIKKNLAEIIPRLSEGLTEIVDLLAPEIPVLVEDLLPPIITGASTLLAGLANRLPQLLTTILPALSEGVVNVSVALVEVMPQLITSLKESIPIIVRTIMSKKDDLLKAGKDLVSSLFPSDMSKVPEIMTSAVSTVTTFAADITDPKNLKTVIDKGFDIINALLDGLTKPETLDAFMDPETGVIKIIENIGAGLTHFSVELISSATQIIKNLGDYLNNEENRQQLFATAKEILVKIGKGLTSTEARDAVGGLVVEAAKFIADMFIGGIDWDAKGGEIAKQLIQGVYNNLWTTRLGNWIAESIEGDVNSDIHDWLDSGSTLSLEDFQNTRRNSGNSEAYKAITGVPSNLAEYYEQKYRGYATGFFADRPAVLNNTVVGENGDEVLLPLDTHTEWMDKLASRINGGASVENLNVTVNVAGAMDESSVKQAVSMMIDEISLQLSDLQGRESRGYGLGFTGGAWT